MPLPHGVFITQGPTDWQIIQQDARGFGSITVSGRWAVPGDRQEAKVFVRLVRTDDAGPVTAALDWFPATTGDGTWSAGLTGIPAGGLYRLETQIRTATSNEHTPEWAIRGDARDFLGVGDLWVIAGQSNAAGYGKGPIEDAPELGVHLFSNARAWRLASHPLHDVTGMDAINAEWANPGHSPWLVFARRLRRTLGHPIGLIATALGGSPLQRWNPGEHSDPLKADLCTNFLQAIAQAGGRVRGVVWYQGCSDTGETTAPTYLERFSQAVAHWRQALAAPDLPIISVQLDRVTTTQTEAAHLSWSIVREAQRQAAKRLAQVAVLPAHDLPLSDFVHVSPAGNLVLGQRAANAALGLAYGRTLAWQAPEATHARRSTDGLALTLAVAHVTGTLREADATRQPFRVEDSRGPIAVTGLEYQRDAIVLRLARALDGTATVSAGCGAHPEPLPVDMTRNIPLLAFHLLPVE